MRMTLGEMLKRFRIEKEIKAEEICEGLCTRTLIIYYESGKGAPDTLLFIRFMERMGVSPELFALMVSEKENEYYKWQEQINEAIEAKQWECVGELLEQPVAFENECNEVLVRQYYYYTKAIYLAETKKQYKEAAELIREAIALTIPDVHITLQKRVLLGTTEIHMLVLYLFYGMLGNILDEETGRNWLELVEQYISGGRLEIAEQAKIYPKLICVGMKVLKNSLSAQEQLCMCKKAVELLRRNKTFYDITELLEKYIELLHQTDDTEVRFYEKQYDTFLEILNDNNIDASFRPEVLSGQKPRLYIINEYLYSRRKEKNLTQEKLSEGICEPETYSRVERGTRVPSKRNFVALSERLDINWHYFRGELDTCELEAYRLRRKQREAKIEGRYEKSLEILKQLECLLDMEKVSNCQAIGSAKYVLKYFLGQATAEETFLYLEEKLALTTELKLDGQYVMYYSQTELEIIAEMGRMLKKMKRQKEGIALIETIIQQMQRSKVKFEYQWSGVDFALRILGELLFEEEEYEKEQRILNYVYKINTKIRDGANLPTILDSLADNLEHISRQYSNEYKRLYRQTYYVADFYSINHIRDYTDNYYRAHFEKDFCWY